MFLIGYEAKVQNPLVGKKPIVNFFKKIPIGNPERLL